MKQSDDVKFMLVQFLADLDLSALPKREQYDIKDIISLLSKRTTIFPGSVKSKNSMLWHTQLSRLLELFFCAYPALMTFDNKIALEAYLNEQRQGSKKLRPNE